MEKPESLLDKKHTGGLFGGKGYGFEKSYILSQLPNWLSLTELDYFQQELWSDVELFFKSKKRWLLQIKDHQLDLSEFKEVLTNFQKRYSEIADNGEVDYEKFIIVSTGETSSVQGIRNAVERWRDIQHLSESELASTKTDFIATLKKHKCNQFADFIIANVEKICFECQAGWAKNEEQLRELFVSSLYAKYGIEQKSAQSTFFRMARDLDTERGKRFDLEPLRRMLDKADKIHKSYSTRIDYRRKIAPYFKFYTEYYVGRVQEEQWIINLISKKESEYVLIQAPLGYGKSTFMYHLIKQIEDRRISQWTANGYPNLLYFFIRQNSNTPEAFLRVLNAQMMDILQLDEAVHTDFDKLRDQFNNLWSQLLEVTNNEQPLLLLVDGLDEMVMGPNTIADLLPSNLSSYVHVIVTSRPNPEPRDQVPLEHPLKSAKFLPLPTFSEAEIESLLKEYDSEFDAEADELSPRILSITKGEPLFTRFVCQEIKQSGKNALARLEDNPPDGVTEYFQQQFRQLKNLTGGEIIWDILGLMIVAVGGMTVDELTDVLDLKKREVNRAIKPVKRFLLGEARFELHLQLREIIAEEFSSHEREGYRRKLLTWCKSYEEKEWPQKETPDYPLLYYPQHLKVMKDFEGVHRLIQSREWTETKYVNTPWVDSLIQDLQLASSVSIEEGDSEEWARAMAYQLRRTMIEELMSRFPGEVKVFMAKLGRVDQSLAFARRDWRSFQLFQQIAEVVAETQPDKALDILLQSIHLFDYGTMLNKYGARFVVAKGILDNKKILADVPSSTQKAQDLVRQAKRIQPHISDSDRYSYEAQYFCPILVLTNQFDEAKKLAESLPLPKKSQAFRHISLTLPPNHPEKLRLAEQALSLLESAERNAETITREVQAIVTLLPHVNEKRQAELVQTLILAEREIHSTNDVLTRPAWSWVFENIADLDLEKAKNILLNSEWSSGWRDAWSVLIHKIALSDTQEALDMAKEHCSNHVIYPSVIVDIIRIVAIQFEDIGRAEELIKKYSKELSVFRRQMPEAHLVLAEAYLAQGKKRKSEEIFDEQVYVIDDKGVKRGRDDLLVAMIRRSGMLETCDVETIFNRLENVEDGRLYSAKHLLGHLAARQDKIDFIETHKLGTEAQIGAAFEMINRDPDLARDLWQKWWLGRQAGDWEASRFFISIRVAEAQKTPSKLEEFLLCFDGGDSPHKHDMCYNMQALPIALYDLTQKNQIDTNKAKEIIERVYPVLSNWKCRKEKSDCECYGKSKNALGHLIVLMAQLDRDRAEQMITSLPSEPVKISTLKGILYHTEEPDDVLVNRIIKSSQEIFTESFQLANSYYSLATILPPEQEAWITELIQLADALIEDQTWPSPPTELRVNRAKACMKLVGTPDQFSYVKDAIDRVNGSLRDRLEVLNILAEQAMKWSQQERWTLLRQIWALATIKREVDVEALIAFAIPILESLVDTGKEKLFWRLYDHIEGAYQELPQMNMQ